MINITSVCACLGAQFNEPNCPCTMHRLNLPPSPERLAHEEYCNTTEYKQEQAELWAKLEAKFERVGNSE